VLPTSAVLHAPQVLEIDGFKRANAEKYPEGPQFGLRLGFEQEQNATSE
jgi:hypothetical protein